MSNVVVVFDLVMVFAVWAALIAVEPVLGVTQQEVEHNAITASDFTV